MRRNVSISSAYNIVRIPFGYMANRIASSIDMPSLQMDPTNVDAIKQAIADWKKRRSELGGRKDLYVLECNIWGDEKGRETLQIEELTDALFALVKIVGMESCRNLGSAIVVWITVSKGVSSIVQAVFSETVNSMVKYYTVENRAYNSQIYSVTHNESVSQFGCYRLSELLTNMVGIREGECIDLRYERQGDSGK